MQLLLQRDQGKNIIGRPIFILWAKFDLSGEEMELVTKYHVQNFILYEGNFRRDLTRALRWSAPLSFFVMSLFLFRAAPGPVLLLSLLLFLGLTYIIYEQIRERITVFDLTIHQFLTEGY